MFVNLARDRVLTLQTSILVVVVSEMYVSLRVLKAHGNEGNIIMSINYLKIQKLDGHEGLKTPVFWYFG